MTLLRGLQPGGALARVSLVLAEALASEPLHVEKGVGFLQF